MDFCARYLWARKEESSELCIFFSGWGLGPGCWQHLDIQEKDLLIVYDYGAEESAPDLSKYQSIEVVGYSMGVLMATDFTHTVQLSNITFLLAINGTLSPFSSTFGISPQQIEFTIENMSQSTFNNFLMGVAGDKPTYRKILPHVIPFEKSHLQFSLRYCVEKQKTLRQGLQWNAALLGENDLIFPVGGMRQFWENHKVPSIILNSGHFPFFNWNSWNEILDIGKEKV